MLRLTDRRLDLLQRLQQHWPASAHDLGCQWRDLLELMERGGYVEIDSISLQRHFRQRWKVLWHITVKGTEALRDAGRLA